MTSTIGKEYSSKELDYIPKEDLEIGGQYHCGISGVNHSHWNTLMWDGTRFHCNLGYFHHIDDGRRIGKVRPFERKHEWGVPA